MSSLAHTPPPALSSQLSTYTKCPLENHLLSTILGVITCIQAQFVSIPSCLLWCFPICPPHCCCTWIISLTDQESITSYLNILMVYPSSDFMGSLVCYPETPFTLLLVFSIVSSLAILCTSQYISHYLQSSSPPLLCLNACNASSFLLPPFPYLLFHHLLIRE